MNDTSNLSSTLIQKETEKLPEKPLEKQDSEQRERTDSVTSSSEPKRLSVKEFLSKNVIKQAIVEKVEVENTKKLLREQILKSSHKTMVKKDFEPSIKGNVISLNVMITFLMKKIEWQDVNVKFEVSATIVYRLFTENLWVKLEKQLGSTVVNKEEITNTLMSMKMRRNDKINDDMGEVEYKNLQVFENEDEFVNFKPKGAEPEVFDPSASG